MGSMTEAVQIGKKQEIADFITNIQPDRTPILSLMKAGKRPNAMLMTWQAEQYDDHAFGGVLDGTAVTNYTVQNRSLITGACSWLREQWRVSKLAEITEVAAVGRNEAARQKVVAMLQLKRQMEKMIGSASQATSESGATPWTSWGIFGLLDATLAGSGAPYPVPAAVRPVAGTEYTSAIASFTEASLKSMFDTAFLQKKGELDLVGFVGTTLRGIIDDFTSVLKSSSSTSQPRTIYRVQGNSVYMNKVTDIEFSTGKAMLITTPFLLCDATTGAQTDYSSKSGAFIDPSMWDIGYMSPISAEDLPIDGGGPKGFVDVVAGVRGRNPLAQPIVYTAT